MDAGTVRNTQTNESDLRFEIQCENRTYYLEANDAIELKMWLRSLKQAKLASFSKSENNISTLRNSDLVNIPRTSEVEEALLNPDWEGYLMKRGMNNQGWKRRWFVLKYPNFYYFHSSQVSSSFFSPSPFF